MDLKEKIEMAFKKHIPETEMTPEDFRLLLKMQMSKDVNLNIDINTIDKDSEIYKHFEPMIKSFLAQVFLTRIEKLTTLKMTLLVLIALLMHMENPSDCVIYSLYLEHKLKPNTLVTFDVFGQEACRWGMFSREQLRDIWAILETKES